MPLHLPSRPDLAHLKREAKALLAAIRSGAAEPLQRLRTLFAAATPDSAKLAEVQTLLARDYGFPSWPALGAAVVKRGEQARAKAARRAERTARAAEFAASWFALAEAGDLDILWQRMGVGKHAAHAARAIMLTEPERYDRFVATVIAGLGHPSSRARFAYAHILDSFGDARCIAPLRALMDDPVPRVRWMAVHALTCHDCNEQTCPDDPELLARIADFARHDPSLKVRRHAAIALGEAGGPREKPLLEEIVAQAGDPALKRAAAYGLRTLAERLG